MTTFAVTDSTLSAVHLSLLIQEKYGFGKNTQCKLFRTGINHTYMVSENEIKYALRIYSYKWRTELEIREELRLLILLKENDISVSFPIPDLNGDYLQTINAPEGIRFGVLFSYAKGTKVRNLSANTCYSIGALMAKLHYTTINQTLNRVDYNSKTLTQLPYQYATTHFSESIPEMQFLKYAGEQLTTLFNGADSSKLRYGSVHLDLWYDNMNIEDEETITIFDFDFCGNGWLLLDLAYFNLQLFNTEPDLLVYQSKSDSFIKGYQDITLISEEEFSLIPHAGLALWIFYFGVQSQRFDNWSNIFLSENYLKHFIGIIRKWLKFNEITIEGESKHV